MSRASARALRALVLAPLLLVGADARADVLASPCEVEYFERYLDERCVMCEASEYEPERCRRALAGAGLGQRCVGSPLGSTRGSSMWGELWCLARGDESSPLPAAPPPLERVADPEEGGSPVLPPIPAGFRDPPPLDPTDPSALAGPPATDLAPEAGDHEPPTPALTPTPAPAPQAGGGCLGCRVDEPSAAGLLGLFLGLLGLAGRRPVRRP